MAQGEFTKEADETKEASDEILKAMPRKLSLEFLGHFNNIFLFI